MLLAALALSSSDTVIVQTADGLVRGIKRQLSSAFLGVPFAKPPVADLRWQPPVRVAPWQGVLNATNYGPSCADTVGGEEDCLRRVLIFFS